MEWLCVVGLVALAAVVVYVLYLAVTWVQTVSKAKGRLDRLATRLDAVDKQLGLGGRDIWGYFFANEDSKPDPKTYIVNRLREVEEKLGPKPKVKRKTTPKPRKK